MGLFGKKDSKNFVSETVASSGSLFRAIVKRMRERRKHIRVRYPEAGAIGDLPTVELQSSIYSPLTLSQGGVRLDISDKNLVVGEKYQIKIIWKFGPLIFHHEAELIRRSGNFYHFKFLKVDPRAFMEFSKSFKNGIEGVGTRRVTDKVPTYLLEYWQSPSGNKILFQKTRQGEGCEIYYESFRVSVSSDGALAREEQDENGHWRLKPANQDVVDEVIILLTNIFEPSNRITQTLALISHKYYS